MFYLDLFATLNRHQVSYVLIGGLAVALHGVDSHWFWLSKGEIL
jgi:hypothetical protein